MKQVTTTRRKPSRLARAAAWMAVTLISFVAMAVAVRELSSPMGTFEIMFFRSLVGLAVVLPIVLTLGWDSVRSGRLGLHAARNIFHFGGQGAWIYGLTLLPLAEVTAIEFTTPIWLAILAVVFLRERLDRGRLVAIVLGFTGILVILWPGIEAVQPGALVVLAGALGFASTHIFTKKLTATESPLAILFYMSVVQLPLGLVPALFAWVPPTLADAPWLVILGVSALTAHYGLIRAFRLADATVAIPMDFLRLPLVAVVGFLLYAEQFEFAVLGGAVLIFAGNYYNIRRQSRVEALEPDTTPY